MDKDNKKEDLSEIVREHEETEHSDFGRSIFNMFATLVAGTLVKEVINSKLFKANSSTLADGNIPLSRPQENVPVEETNLGDNLQLESIVPEIAQELNEPRLILNQENINASSINRDILPLVRAIRSNLERSTDLLRESKVDINEIQTEIKTADEQLSNVNSRLDDVVVTYDYSSITNPLSGTLNYYLNGISQITNNNIAMYNELLLSSDSHLINNIMYLILAFLLKVICVIMLPFLLWWFFLYIKPSTLIALYSLISDLIKNLFTFKQGNLPDIEPPNPPSNNPLSNTNLPKKSVLLDLLNSFLSSIEKKNPLGFFLLLLILLSMLTFFLFIRLRDSLRRFNALCIKKYTSFSSLFLSEGRPVDLPILKGKESTFYLKERLSNIIDSMFVKSVTEVMSSRQILLSIKDNLGDDMLSLGLSHHSFHQTMLKKGYTRTIVNKKSFYNIKLV